MAGTTTGQGLGYYVHYHAENYRKYGIVPKNSNKQNVSASEAYGQTHHKLMQIANSSRGKDADLKGMENFLNKLSAGNFQEAYALLGADNEKDIDFEAILNDVVLEVNKKFPNFSFNFQNLTLESLYSEMRNLYVKKERDEQGKTRQRISVESIDNLFISLSNILENINNTIASGNIPKKELQKIQKSKKTLENLQNGILKMSQNPDYTESKKYIRLQTQSSKNLVNKIVNDVKNLSKSINIPNNAERGEAAEYALALLMMKMVSAADKEIQKTLEDIWKGKENVVNSPLIKGNSFCHLNKMMVNFEKKGSNFNDPGGKRYGFGSDGGIIDLKGSMGTVDLELYFPSNAFNVNGLGASLKNYENGSKRNISIVSGTSLLNAFNFVTTDFANHYLNLIATHDNVLWSNLSDRAVFDKIFRFALVMRGLMGVRDLETPSNLNEVFILHDTTTQKYSIYDAGELAMEIWKNLGTTVSGEIKGEPIIGGKGNVSFSGLPGQQALAAQNKWVTSIYDDYNAGLNDMAAAMERITGLLSYTHKIKLTMSINLKNL